MSDGLNLHGCTPVPLAGYLKGLAVLRLVAEQADGAVLGSWREGCFHLLGGPDRAGLVEFFLERYRPTPVAAPWNGGSGFYPKDNQSGIGALEGGSTGRFALYREVIAQCRTMVAAQGLETSPKDTAKASLLARLRAELPDAALAWLDAAVLLTDEATRYPPLLGTGGNDGRLDFTNNFMQRLAELFDPRSGAASPAARPLLEAALFGDPVPGLPAVAIGQFSPGAAGGPNATTGFDAGSLTNPWDFVLMLEGALPFAAAATRRLEAADGARLSYPFTVRTTGGGSGSIALRDEEAARAEMWLPLWERPARYDEIRALLAEGRVTLGRRPARDGLDFARAVAGLGVDRGIAAFQRYAFLMRSGKAYLATPLNRVRVRRNPAADLLADLDRDGWLGRLRGVVRQDAPGRITRLVARLDRALFDLVTADPRQQNRRLVQRVLELIGEIQLLIGQSPRLRESFPRPLRLGPEWFQQADDRSQAFRIAAAFASIATRELPFRSHLAPVAPDPAFKGRRDRWVENDNHVVWGKGPLCDRLFRVLERRRLVLASGSGRDGEGEPSRHPFGGLIRPGIEAIEGFLHDDGQDAAILALLQGLVWVALPRVDEPPPRRVGDTPEGEAVSLAYALFKPFFISDEPLHRSGLLLAGLRLHLPAPALAKLRQGEVKPASAIALRTLRAAGLNIGFTGGIGSGVPGRRLAAALMLPVGHYGVKRLMNDFVGPPRARGGSKELQGELQ